MKIVFMGTPDFAVPSLTALADEGHEIQYAVTQRDKPKNRGNKIQLTPVKEKAEGLGIEVLQPDKIRGDDTFIRKIREAAPDMIVVAAYGQILPGDLLCIPKYGCVNVHASLLPRWRGAAPIQRAIIEGDEKTGITIMYMEEGLDTGDIILSESTEIGQKNAATLHDELAYMGADLLISAIGRIEGGTAERIVQDSALVTYAGMIFKKDGMLDFGETPERLSRIVRGLYPRPGAYTEYKGTTMKVWEAYPLDKANDCENGTITEVSDAGMAVSAGGRTLLITEIQMPGKKRVKINEYLKGNTIEKFAILG